MKILDGIRAVGTQVLRTTDEFGETIKLTLKFSPTCSEWYLDVEHGDTVITNQRINISLNMLWPYAKILRFGLGVIAYTKAEPFLINDFSSERIQLAILTNDELEEIDAVYISEREQ